MIEERWPVAGGAGAVRRRWGWPTEGRRRRRSGCTSVPAPEAAVGPGAFTIDCADCTHRDSPVCDDCVVSFIVGREPEDALVVDAEEARAVRLLERAGLVPGVRHVSQASGR